MTVGDWKLIWTPFQTGSLGWELYNVREDPHETRDLHRPEHPRFEPLRQRLLEWTKRAGPTRAPRAVSESDQQKLRALGYAE